MTGQWRICDLPQEIAAEVRIHPDSGCWIYGGNLNPGGYGWVDKTLIHRLSYERLVGPIPPGLTLDHVKTRGCISKACCWPGHLEPVTRAENSRRNAQRERTRTSMDDTPRADGVMLEFTAEDARREWRRILNAVESGEPVGITRYGKPLAVVVPAGWYEQAQAAIESIKGCGPS